MKFTPRASGLAFTPVLAAAALGLGLTLALPLQALANSATAAAVAFKPDMAKAQKLVTEVCGACHSADGSRGAPANPILQGQHPEYLAGQLEQFKSGKRKNAVMQGMVAQLSDGDMKSLAAFYGGKAAKPGFARNKDTVAQGERLYRGGNIATKLPACSGCHGPAGAGLPSQYPRLAGQHADYTEAQLLAFRNGTRTNHAGMATIASRLSDKDIKAIADYLAGLR